MASIGEHDILLTPQGIEKGRKLPLVVFLHSAGGSAADMEKIVAPLVDAWRYFIFLPTGTIEKKERSNAKLLRDWDPFNDVTTLIAKIEEIIRRHEVDPSLVFLSGFSSGATMSYLVGFERPELFAGVISFCGILQRDLLDIDRMRAAKTKLPVCVAHGWQDTSVPWDRANAAISYLHAQGFKVKSFFFDGGHFFPSNWMDILKSAIEWCNNQGVPATTRKVLE